MGEYTCILLHNNPHEHEEEEEEEARVLDEEEDDHEMALSLCDLPLGNHQELASPRTSSHSISHRRSTSQPHELFEFFSDLSSEMCSAEDMILCGKLVPFKEQPPPPPLPLPHPHPLPPIKEPPGPQMGGLLREQNNRRSSLITRRSESAPGRSISFTRSQSTTKLKKMRSSRSLDYRKLNRGFSSSSSSSSSLREQQDEASPMRSSSMRSSVGEISSKSGGGKPGWFVLMFGAVKPHNYGQMELKDMKIRQSRRNPSTMFLPVEDSGGGGAKNAVASKGYPCRLLKVLSCKSHASVAVETSLYHIPHGI